MASTEFGYKGMNVNPCSTKSLETLPDVFIIESLGIEFNGGIQGRALAGALKAFEHFPRYREVSSKAEFRRALAEFKDSGYRYLHVSCHGDIVAGGLILRNGELLTFKAFVDMIGELQLPLTRLFLSACDVGATDRLANCLFANPKTRAVHSVLAPKESIDLTESLVFWVAFYGEMYMRSDRSMKDSDIIKIVQAASNCCQRKFSYFGYTPTEKSIRRWSIYPDRLKYEKPVVYPLTVSSNTAK